MPKGKKLHWTKTKTGKEKIAKAKEVRRIEREMTKNVNSAGMTQAIPQTVSFDYERKSREDFERFQRKPRELAIRINSLEIHFYFD